MTKQNKYVIGIDYGTLSGRAALVNIENGEIIATAVYPYPHGVMDEKLPTGEKLPPDWALQHPQDHMDVLLTTIPELLGKTTVDPADILGIALDVTSATVMPVTQDGAPMCLLDEYRRHPHAWMKLWKHHAAQKYADRMTQIAIERGESFLQRYGGRINSEWSLPKLYQVMDEAPEIYGKAAYWIESADWLVWMLTGRATQNACSTGYKCLYENGSFPSEEYFAAVDERLRHVIREKMNLPVINIGSKAGELTEEMASRLGLMPGTAVAAGNVDAHVSALAAGLMCAGRMAAIIGTSACHMLLGEKDTFVPGICGAVHGGILPDYWGYESGQPCVGDHLAWLTENYINPEYHAAAAQRGMSIHQYLTEKAGSLRPGESGVMALDWWNGNRSILGDADLSGLLIGLTLRTKPEEIYRALLESTAYGTRTIIENYRSHGVPVNEFYALGGISRKNALMMQILADVLHMPIHVVDAQESGSLGSAILAAAACGAYPTVQAAVAEMSAPEMAVYLPNEKMCDAYDALYAQYAHLHDLFGRSDPVMKHLRALRG